MKFKHLLVTTGILLAVPKMTQAQIDYNNVPEVTNKIFINDALVHINPSQKAFMADILIEDGVIKQVAANIIAPNDARVIQADSAYAYAAFIDGLSHLGIPKKERGEERPSVKFKGFPPDDVAGITPEIKSSDLIKMDDSSINSFKEAGFAISHVVPTGLMLPGQGSVISLKESNIGDALLKDESSLFFQLDGARGMYPSTVIGVMAKWRELFRNAYYNSKNTNQYTLSPQGNKRPSSDKVITALHPVVEGKMPVFMKTNKAKDIFRAIDLQKDLGYKLILSDVKQIGATMKHLKSSDIGILLSLDLPKEKKTEKKEGADSKETKGPNKRNKKDKSSENTEEKEEIKDSLIVDPTTKMLQEKKAASLETYLKQAGQLEKEGIPFSFSMLSTKPSDFKPNLLKLIKNGLSEAGALAALTTNPAKLLDVDKITGTLEAGKLANIIICDKSYFDEKSQIKYVIVEGELTEIKLKKEKKSAGNGDGNIKIDGTWSYKVDVFGELQTGVIEIENNDGDVSVELTDDSTPDRTDIATEISFQDGSLKFKVVVDADGQEMPVIIVLNFDQNDFSGSATIEDVGSFDMTGSKLSSPE